MADHSAIEWTDATFNPWIGCTKISPACDRCYATISTPARTLGIAWGAGEPRRRTSIGNWKLPLKWERGHKAFFEKHGRRQRVFCASLADIFDNEVDPDWRRDVFSLIRVTPHLDWLLLTKRIGNAAGMIAQAVSALLPDEHCGTGQWNHSPIAQWPWPNVWLGATICNQLEADRDILKLLAAPARVRFLSIEPMLGPVDLTHVFDRTNGSVVWRNVIETREANPAHGELAAAFGPESQCNRVDWVITGGESGPGARPMHPSWARSIRDECAAAGVPFFFKQWGEYVQHRQSGRDLSFCYENSREGGWLESDGSYSSGENAQPRAAVDSAQVFRLGKRKAGRLLDGMEHNAYPEIVR